MSETLPIDPTEPHAQRSYTPLRVLAIVMALVGIAGFLIGWTSHVDPKILWRGYLVGIYLWLGTSLGCLFFSMMHNLSGGEWGKILRRPLEAGMACLPIMALLFVPLFFVLPNIYEWADPAKVDADKILKHREAWMNPTFIISRTVVFFSLWSFIAITLYGQGRKIRENGEKHTTGLAYKLSAFGMVAHFFTVTCFIIDFVMSRDSHWMSSIIGFVNMASQGLMALSMTIFALCWRFGRADNKMPIEKMTLNDAGTMMLANTIFWCYTSIAQLIITYSGNSVHEQVWYIQRGFGRNLSNNWQYVAVLLIICGFAIPFVLLLMRDLKQRMKYLALIAVWVFLMRWVDVIWWIVPSGVHVTPEHFEPNALHWVDLSAMVGIGGIWLSFFFWFLGGRPVLSPATEPKPHRHGHGHAHAPSGAAPHGTQAVSHG